MTTLFLRPRRYYNTIIILIRPKRNVTDSFYYFENPDSATTSFFFIRILWPNGGRINEVSLYRISFYSMRGCTDTSMGMEGE